MSTASRNLVMLSLLAGVAGVRPATGGQAIESAFDSEKGLTGWAITGNVAIDRTIGRKGGGGSLKVGPGGQALLKLRDGDESGSSSMATGTWWGL